MLYFISSGNFILERMHLELNIKDVISYTSLSHLKPTTSQAIERTPKISQGVLVIGFTQGSKYGLAGERKHKKHLGPKRLPYTATQATVLVLQGTLCLRNMNQEDEYKESWFSESLSKIFQWDCICPIGIAGSSQVALVVKNPPVNAGDMRDIGLMPGSGRFPGGGHCNPCQYSCLENPMDQGAWRATVYRVTKSQTRLKQLDTYTHIVLKPSQDL